MILILTLLFLLLPSQILFPSSPDKDEIINKFINTVKTAKIIKYKSNFFFKDDSKGETKINIKCAFKNVPEDTVVGIYYNFSSVGYYNNNILAEESQKIYTGNEYLQYNPKEYGEKIVKVLIKKKHPKEFTNREIQWNCQTLIATSVVKGSYEYGNSIIELMNQIKDIKEYKRFNFLSDTMINGYECNQLYFILNDSIIDNGLEFNSYTFAFDKKTGLLVYYCYYVTTQKQLATQETKVLFTDYSINENNNDELFTRKAFPKNYKFTEHPPVKKEKTLKIGTAAPLWELKTINDKQIKLQDLKGQPVLLVFSEIGCVPCMFAIPDLIDIVKEFKNVKVIGIYPIDSKDALKNLVDKKGISYDILYNSMDVAKQYHGTAYPAFFLIDKEGILRYSFSGYGTGMKAEITKEINKVIKK